MRLSIPQPAFEAALRAAAKVAPGRTGLPILANAYIEATNSGAVIRATNLDQYIEIGLGAQTEVVGACSVPLKNVLETISEIPGGSLQLSLANFHLEIRTDLVGFSGRIAAFEGSEFPGPPSGDQYAQIEIPRADLSAICRQVAFAVSTDATRLVLNGVCLRKTYTHIEAVATDGIQFARLNLPNTTARDGDTWIVPPQALLLVNQLYADSDTSTNMFALPAAALFEFPANSAFAYCKVWTKLVEGPYPQYLQLIPKATAWAAEFHREDLIRIVKRVRAVAKNPTNCPAILFDQIPSATSGRVRISGASKTHGTEGFDEIPATISGPMPPIAWNGNLLLEILALINEPQIVLRGNSPTNATVIEPLSEKPSLLTILMPTRRAD